MLVVASLGLPIRADAVGDEDWRKASAHAKANTGILVFVLAKADGEVIRESAYCGATVIRNDEVLTAWHCIDSQARLADTWVATYDGKKFKVTGIAREAIGWDLVLLKAPGVRPVGNIVIQEDIQTGDEVMGIGSPFGLMFKATWGRVDRIYFGYHDVCDGFGRRPNPLGHKEHQVIEVDRVSFFGFSGGGVWNRQGELVGVHVRGAYWEPYEGYSCGESYKGEYLVFGAMVGPKTINAFMRGEVPK